MNVPFVNPEDGGIASAFKKDIEEMWTWGSWNLKLNYKSDALAHVAFEKNTTAHADSVAGNQIIMDSVAPINEARQMRLIPHEFGHLLGFVDCYVEFFDSEENLMVNYQIDTRNIMCSLKGKVLESHYTELKKVYFQE